MMSLDLDKSDAELLEALQTHLGTDAGDVIARGLRSLAAATGWPFRRDLDSYSSVTVFPSFARAAAAACEFEVRMRLLMDNTGAFGNRAVTMNLDPLATEALAHFAKHVTAEDRVLIPKAVRIRNKLVHLEISRVTGTVVSLGVSLEDPNVRKLDLATGEVTAIAQTRSRDGGVYGWLLQGHQSHTFDACVDVFCDAIEVLSRWRDASDAERDATR